MPRRRASLASASPEAALRDNLFFCDAEGEAHLPLLTAGVDEAGRGPLAGPVCAAAVILDPENPIEGLADSKKLSAKKREALAPIIRERALAWSIGWATVEEIDRVNILNATYLAMERAVAALKSRSGSVTPEYILIDGNRRPPHLPCMSDTIVKGDDKVPAIRPHPYSRKRLETIGWLNSIRSGRLTALPNMPATARLSTSML